MEFVLMACNLHIHLIGKTIMRRILFIAVFLILSGSFQAGASEQNRYNSRPSTIFCKSLAAMRTMQISFSQQNKRRIVSLLNSGECKIAETEVVVYVVQEEKDVVRIQMASSGKYFWVSRKALR
jgi:hypothetical protein